MFLSIFFTIIIIINRPENPGGYCFWLCPFVCRSVCLSVCNRMHSNFRTGYRIVTKFSGEVPWVKCQVKFDDGGDLPKNVRVKRVCSDPPKNNFHIFRPIFPKIGNQGYIDLRITPMISISNRTPEKVRVKASQSIFSFLHFCP